MTHVRRSALAALTATALAVLPALVITPAYATTYDVAGLRLDFGNDVDQNILQNGELNESYLYENVVTVGGAEIDALVTIVGMSDNSLGDYAHEFISAAQIDILNADNTEHVDAAGCYSTPEYVAAYDAGEAYDFLGFNAPGALKGGTEVSVIDEFEDDPEFEHAISTSLWLCDPGYTSDVDGYVQINVEFQVAGAPVTLNNVRINATDIDNSQEVTFWNPAPTSFETSGGDSLVEIIDHSVGDDYITFVGPDELDDDLYPERYVGEVYYESVSDFNYTFELIDAGSGGMEIAFESYFNPASDGLASTGVDAAPAGIAGLAVLGLGAAAVVARRVRRNRA